MRTGTLIAALALPALIGADKPKAQPPDVNNVGITLTLPVEVPLVEPKRRGDAVAILPITVTIKNKGTGGVVPFGLHYLEPFAIKLERDPLLPVRGEWSYRWIECPLPQNHPVFGLAPGQSYATTIHYSFPQSKGQPRTGDTFGVTLKLYGLKAEGSFTFK